MKTRAQRFADWERARRTVAVRWFNGDDNRANAVLDALPYSSVPDWSDVDRVMRAVTGEMS